MNKAPFHVNEFLAPYLLFSSVIILQYSPMELQWADHAVSEMFLRNAIFIIPGTKQQEPRLSLLNCPKSTHLPTITEESQSPRSAKSTSHIQRDVPPKDIQKSPHKISPTPPHQPSSIQDALSLANLKGLITINDLPSP
jgi:hypothetical protein